MHISVHICPVPYLVFGSHFSVFGGVKKKVASAEIFSLLLTFLCTMSVKCVVTVTAKSSGGEGEGHFCLICVSTITYPSLSSMEMGKGKLDSLRECEFSPLMVLSGKFF